MAPIDETKKDEGTKYTNFHATRSPHVTPEEYKEETGDDMVTMEFPKRVLLTLDDRRRIDFPAGIHEVPATLAVHPYLKDCGAKPYTPKKAANKWPMTAKSPDVTERHVKFLNARGYKVSSVAEANTFIQALDPEARPGFFRDAEEWKETPITTSDPATDGVDLSKMTKAELIAHADEVHGLELKETAKKEELIDAIEKAQKDLSKE